MYRVFSRVAGMLTEVRAGILKSAKEHPLYVRDSPMCIENML